MPVNTPPMFARSNSSAKWHRVSKIIEVFSVSGVCCIVEHIFSRSILCKLAVTATYRIFQCRMSTMLTTELLIILCLQPTLQLQLKTMLCDMAGRVRGIASVAFEPRLVVPKSRTRFQLPHFSLALSIRLFGSALLNHRLRVAKFLQPLSASSLGVDLDRLEHTYSR